MKPIPTTRLRLCGVRPCVRVYWPRHGARTHRSGCAAEGLNSDDDNKVDMDALARRLSEEAKRMREASSHSSHDEIDYPVVREQQGGEAQSSGGEDLAASAVCSPRTGMHYE
jgi:hypothetical protein